MKKKPTPDNAFNWRGKPSIFTQGRAPLSEKQIVTNALRVNREATLTAFVPPEHAQRIRKAKI